MITIKLNLEESELILLENFVLAGVNKVIEDDMELCLPNTLKYGKSLYSKLRKVIYEIKR